MILRKVLLKSIKAPKAKGKRSIGSIIFKSVYGPIFLRLYRDFIRMGLFLVVCQRCAST